MKRPGIGHWLGSPVLAASILTCFVGAGIISCQHVRVQLKDTTVLRECDAYNNARYDQLRRVECERAKERLRERRKKAATPADTNYAFYFWGLYPAAVTVKAQEVCPDGVKEIYAYSTWKDELFANLTAGIYVPRTLRITCLTEVES